ncbi:MAG: exopolysaccharide biosynthesis protein [Alphaproteobacteria bacterium]
MHKPLNPFALLRQSLTHRVGDYITLEELRDAFGNRAFGLLLLLTVAACTFIPIPGLGLILGFLPLILGAMLCAGFSRPWLPSAVLKKPIKQKYFHQFLDKAEPHWVKIEKYLHPRWEWVFHPWAERVMGALIILQSIFVILPGPLTNLLPSIAMLLLALALLVRDGLMALVSYALGLFFMTVLTLLYGGLIYTGYTALQRVWG